MSWVGPGEDPDRCRGVGRTAVVLRKPHLLIFRLSEGTRDPRATDSPGLLGEPWAGGPVRTGQARSVSLLITSQVCMAHCTHSGPREVGKASPLGLRSPANATLTGWLSLGDIRNQETVCGAKLWQGRWVGCEETPVSCGLPTGVSGGDPKGLWLCSSLGASRNVALPLKVQLCVLQRPGVFSPCRGPPLPDGGWSSLSQRTPPPPPVPGYRQWLSLSPHGETTERTGRGPQSHSDKCVLLASC